MQPKFRFQDLEIWKEAIEIGLILFDIADRMEQLHLYRFASQIRGVGMSISNNIAESTGTNYTGEQCQLLRVARRECFEGANILILLDRKGLLLVDEINPILTRLDILSRIINHYMDSLEWRRAKSEEQRAKSRVQIGEQRKSRLRRESKGKRNLADGVRASERFR